VGVGPLLEEDADLLAGAVRAQAQQMAVERRLVGPAQLPVGWQGSRLPVAGPVEAATAQDGAIRFPALPGLAPVGPADLRQGGRDDLYAVYGGIASGRLLILGPGGAGKSSAALLLQLDALRHREQLDDRRHVPVPVLVTPHGWNPRTTSVRDWLAGKLIAFPPLAGRRGRARAAALIEAGRVAVFVDGLDEVNESLRAMMLQALSEQVTFRLVLLTRSVELVAATQAALLIGAVALQLDPLRPADAAAYLRRHVTDPMPVGWHAVTEEITAPGAGPLRLAMTNPLNLTLLLQVYRLSGPVDELLDRDRYGTAEDVELHLLDHVLDTAYAPRLGAKLPPYTTRTAHRTLGFLAHRLTVSYHREFGWWDFYRWVSMSPATLLLNSLIAVVLGGLVGAAVVLPVAGLDDGLMVAAGFALLFVTPGGSLHQVPVRFGAAWRRDRFTGRPAAPGLSGQLKGWLVTAALLAVIAGGSLWWIAGPVAGLAAAGLTAVAVLVLSLAVVLLTAPNTGDTSWSEPRLNRWQDVSAAVIMGPLLGLCLGGISAAVRGPAVGVLTGLLFGLFGGLIVTEAWASLLSQVNLAVRHRTPVRLMRFVEDARRRHLFRTVGPAYQFRHLKVQEHLAGQYLIEHHAPATGPRTGADPIARHVLCVGAMLDPAGVPAEVFGKAIAAMPAPAPPGALEAAVRGLLRSGLLALVAEAPDLSAVNVLVQRAVRGRLDATERAAVARAAADALLASWPPEGDAAEVWRANTVALMELAGDALWRPEVHEVLQRAARNMREAGLPPGSFGDALLATARRVLGDDHPQTRLVRDYLAEWSGATG
jgi:hypothetical protein